ncbi:hypothetical protein GCM10009530_77660 [Microbispora corallina]|uniref:Transposase n=1 Tax=Microbispora corallina TaxID=83302 RepID=A0ABQ4GC80_9ACTN|nr:hypothetical protein Mco01_76160 [Microbispora corallina]
MQDLYRREKRMPAELDLLAVIAMDADDPVSEILHEDDGGDAKPGRKSLTLLPRHRNTLGLDNDEGGVAEGTACVHERVCKQAISHDITLRLKRTTHSGGDAINNWRHRVNRL